MYSRKRTYQSHMELNQFVTCSSPPPSPPKLRSSFRRYDSDSSSSVLGPTPPPGNYFGSSCLYPELTEMAEKKQREKLAGPPELNPSTPVGIRLAHYGTIKYWGDDGTFRLEEGTMAIGTTDGGMVNIAKPLPGNPGVQNKQLVPMFNYKTGELRYTEIIDLSDMSEFEKCYWGAHCNLL